MSAPMRESPAVDAGAATITGLLAGSELRPGELVAGRFRIEQLLGIGGMGVVYRAHDTQLDVPVALKLLRPELASRPDAFERFRQELLLARQVSSPHVVRIHDLVQHEGRWLISMDFVPGQSLERLLDVHGPLAVDDAVRIARQLALGLAAAHRRGVVHRDLKPANVLLDETLDAYVGDFGVARSAGVSGITGSGVVVGTPEYLSPEQARAEAVDGRSDLYALGLILYEMLTGKLPFPPGTPAETLAQRLVRSPRAVSSDRPDLPRWLVRCVARLLQLQPARRFQDADSVVRALDTRRVPWRAPPRRLVVAAAIALAALGAGAWWLPHLLADASTRLLARPATEVDVALLPLSASDAATQPIATAITDLLAQALLQGRRAADPERVERTLHNLGFDATTARRQVARSGEALGARRLLAGDLERDGERLRLTLRALDPRDATGTAPMAVSGWLTPDALALQAPLLLAQVGYAVPAGASTPSWPQRADTLAAYGLGLQQLARHDAAQAQVAFERATAGEPGFALAWNRRTEAARLAGGNTIAAEVADAGIKALAARTDRGVDILRAQAALASDEADRARTLLEPLVAATPSDHPLAVMHARALLAAGDLAATRRALDPVVASDPGNAEAWLLLGRAAILAGDAQRGVDDYLVRAQLVYTRLDDARGQADTMNAFGVGYQRLGLNDPAIDNFARAAAARERLGDIRGAAVSLRNRSAALAVRGDFDAAAADLAHARKLLEDLHDAAGVADAINGLGLLEEERGEFAKALAAYREALTLRESLGNPALLAESLNNVGFSYFQMGEFDNAQVYLSQAQAAAAKAEDLAGTVHVQQLQGQLAIARGEFAEARSALADALATSEAQQMPEERAVGLAALADLDRIEGRMRSALERAAAAAGLFAERKDARGMAELRLQQAAIYLDLRAWDEAARVLGEFGTTAPENREQAAALELARSALALGRDDPAGARGAAERAIALAHAAHSLAVVLPARHALARALAAAGDAASARDALEVARREAAHYDPLPLRLERAQLDAELLPSTAALASYRAAAQRIAALPGYGRAAWLHRRGAVLLRAARDDAGAAEADRLAASALASLVEQTPVELRSALALRPAEIMPP